MNSESRDTREREQSKLKNPARDERNRKVYVLR